MQPSRGLLAFGRWSGEGSRAMELAAKGAGLTLVVAETLQAGQDALRGSLAAVAVDVTRPETEKFCTAIRSRSQLSHLPVFAISPEVGDLAFAKAFRWGADDVVSSKAMSGLVSRIARIPDRSTVRPPPPRGMAVVADSVQSRCEIIGRLLTSVGYSVTYASDARSAEERAVELGATLGVLNAAIADPAKLIRDVRAKGCQGVWVVLCGARDLPKHTEAVSELEGVATTNTIGPPEGVLFLSNELSNRRAGELRNDKRLLHGMTIAFREPTATEDELGFSYNLGPDGLFLRTLALPLGDTVSLECKPPKQDRKVRLTAHVAWRRELGPGSASPPGLGLRLTTPEGDDLRAWRDAYRLLLVELSPRTRLPSSHNLNEVLAAAAPKASPKAAEATLSPAAGGSPKAPAVAPKTDAASPKPPAAIPKAGAASPKAPAVAPKADVVSPKPPAIAAQTSDASPKPPVAAKQPGEISPTPPQAAVAPRGAAQAPARDEMPTIRAEAPTDPGARMGPPSPRPAAGAPAPAVPPAPTPPAALSAPAAPADEDRESLPAVLGGAVAPDGAEAEAPKATAPAANVFDEPTARFPPVSGPDSPDDVLPAGGETAAKAEAASDPSRSTIARIKIGGMLGDVVENLVPDEYENQGTDPVDERISQVEEIEAVSVHEPEPVPPPAGPPAIPKGAALGNAATMLASGPMAFPKLPPSKSELTPVPVGLPPRIAPDLREADAEPPAPKPSGSQGPLIAVLGVLVLLGAGAGGWRFLNRMRSERAAGPTASATAPTTASASAPSASGKSVAVPRPSATLTPSAAPSAAPSETAAPSAAPSAPSAAPSATAVAAEAPSAAPAPVPVVPPGADGTDLPATMGYLIVESSVATNVFVHGVLGGPTNERLSVRCGPRFVRLGDEPGKWRSEGVPATIKCRSETRIRIDGK